MADTTKVPKTLLLADASQTTQRIVELALAGDDVRVVTADEGNRALEAMAGTAPDLLLADAALPGMSGFAIAAYLRARPELAHVPVLLLTGVLDAVDPAEAHRAGADGILTKPLDTAVLVARVHELLANGRPATLTHEPAAPLRTGWGATVLDGAPLAVPTLVETTAIEAPVEVQIAPEPSEVQTLPAEPTPDVAAASPSPVATTDDYFDRIDQQFADLARTPRPPMPLDEEPLEPEPDEVEPAGTFVAPTPRAAVPDAPASLPEPVPVPVAAPPVALTDAFAALLDAERGGGSTPIVPVRVASVAPSPAPVAPVQPPAAPAIDLDRLADQIAARVLSQLSDRIVRETVRDVVSTTTERLVREEIERIKRHIK